VGISCADHATPSIRKKLALTSLTSGCRSVGIVRSRTTATEFVCLFVISMNRCKNNQKLFQSQVQCLNLSRATDEQTVALTRHVRLCVITNIIRFNCKYIIYISMQLNDGKINYKSVD
jgi:hypothetical protein